MSKLNRPLIGLMLSAVFASTAHAASFRLEDAAAKAVQTNPDVVNKWNQFKAAGEERNVSWDAICRPSTCSSEWDANPVKRLCTTRQAAETTISQTHE